MLVLNFLTSSQGLQLGHGGEDGGLNLGVRGVGVCTGQPCARAQEGFSCRADVLSTPFLIMLMYSLSTHLLPIVSALKTVKLRKVEVFLRKRLKRMKENF